MYKVTIEVSDADLIDVVAENSIELIVNKIYDTLNSTLFIEYLTKKLSASIHKIALEQLSTVNTQEDVDASLYMNSMKTEINGSTIYLYNDSEIDTSTKIISPEKRAKYPLKLSLAQIVEYGIGYTGFINPLPIQVDWQYDVNDHGYKGWYYTDKSGKTFWTNGFEGRLVFLRLLYWLRDNAANIIAEYLNENMKD